MSLSAPEWKTLRWIKRSKTMTRAASMTITTSTIRTHVTRNNRHLLRRLRRWELGGRSISTFTSWRSEASGNSYRRKILGCNFAAWRFSAAGRFAEWLGRHPGGRKPIQFRTHAAHKNRGDFSSWARVVRAHKRNSISFGYDFRPTLQSSVEHLR
jgi:hypothetical protein